MAISNLTTGLRPGVCTSLSRPTAPYEGQVIYETDTDLSYVWNGSAWQQVSGGTAVGNSGLVFVKQQTVGSAVTSVTVTDAFSSTYDNYKIIYSGGTCTAGTAMRMTIGGSSTGYAYGALLVRYADGTTLALYAANDSVFGAVGEANLNNVSVDIDVLNPNLAKYTTFQGFYTGETLGSAVTAMHKVATAYTSFAFLVGSGTLTGGTITVYGYRKA